MKITVFFFCCLIMLIHSRFGVADAVSNSRTNIIEPKNIVLNDMNKKEIKVKEQKSGSWAPDLSEQEKKILLSIAQDTLNWCVGGMKEPFLFENYDITSALEVKTATFVTLHMHDQLRGCIGSLSPEEALYRSVHNNAINAALRDPRFKPVQSSDLKLLTFDVSLLSPIRPVSSSSDFTPGEHGIIMHKNGRRAVFLPEVAIEQKWTKEETFSHLSMKAGLSADAWKNNADFFVFESVVLSFD